jgi:threonine dehydrogenase-like Zn-dependent dehydrogenase
MKAVVYHDIGKLSPDTVDDPRIEQPTDFITQVETPDTAVQAYETFDQRVDGWVKTVLTVG